MHTAGGKLFGLAVVEFLSHLLLISVGADLHSGVEAVIALVFVFQNEIAINFLGAQKGVGRAGHRGTNYFAILHSIPSLAAFLSPTGKIFAIEDGDKTFFFGIKIERQGKGQAHQGVFHDMRVTPA